MNEPERCPLKEVICNEQKEGEEERYNEIILHAKELIKSNKLEEACNEYKKAYVLFPSPKLESKILKLKNYLTEKNLWRNEEKSTSVNHDSSSVVSAGDAADVDTKLQFKSYVQEGNQHARLGDFAKSYESFDKANQLIPSENIQAQMSKIKLYMENKETEDFQGLVTAAKEHLEQKNFRKALVLYKDAYQLVPSEKLHRRIAKLETHLQNTVQDTSESETSVIQNPTTIEKVSCDSKHTSSEHVEKDEEKGNEQDKESRSIISVEKDEERGNEQDKERRFKQLIAEAKQCMTAEEYREALALYKQAFHIFPGQKLEGRIQKLQKHIDSASISDQEEESPSVVQPQQPNPAPLSNDCFDSAVRPDSLSTTSQRPDRLPTTSQRPDSLPTTSQRPDSLPTTSQRPDSLPTTSQRPDRLSTTSQRPDSLLTTSQTSVETKSSGEVSAATSVVGIPITDAHMAEFKSLCYRAKEAADREDLRGALKLYKKAYKLNPTEKVKNRISKIQLYLAKYSDDEEDAGGEKMVHVGQGFYLFKELYDKLYNHQREGLLWMWGLNKKRKGGILGDDMGLGKTVQVVSLLSGLFDAKKIKAVLIVLPVAVMVNWQNEFNKWAPGISLYEFHGENKRKRELMVQKVARKGGVVMTSYGMLVRPENTSTLANVNDREFIWDYVILDEGHKIKNPSNKCSKGIHSIAAKNRLILTGTPIMNNLKEMWTLFDWTHQGTLLGTAKTFSMQYEGPITRARQKDATAGEKRLGAEIAASFQKLIAPYFLRRTKGQVAKKEKEANDTGGHSGEENAPSMPTLSRKNDLICWVYLSETQQRIYQEFISSEAVKELLNTSKSPLVALTVLKKICDHPRILTTRQCIQLGLTMGEHGVDNEEDDTCAVHHIDKIPDSTLIEESGKLVFLMQLLDHLKATGHRCLVFSMSRKILDIVEKILRNKGHRVARLDGTVRGLQERQEIITRFQENRSYSVFLLTTQVGGVGLTLTAADRVVIFDPSWNPATDAQAVDRAFRIGQTKNVVVYRLITCGSVEEKIYRRQIFKDSVTKLTTGDSNNPNRYFTRQELHELFVLDNPRFSSTQTQLTAIQDGKRKTDTSLDEHIAYLHTLEMFGLSDHDLMFSADVVVEDEDEGADDYVQADEYFQNKVAEAQKLINLEAKENLAQAKQTGRYAAPEVFAEPKPSTSAANKDNPTDNRKPPTVTVPPIFPRRRDSNSSVSSIEQDINNTLADMHIQQTSDNGASGGAADYSIHNMSEEEQMQLALKLSEQDQGTANNVANDDVSILEDKSIDTKMSQSLSDVHIVSDSPTHNNSIAEKNVVQENGANPVQNEYRLQGVNEDEELEMALQMSMAVAKAEENEYLAQFKLPMAETLKLEDNTKLKSPIVETLKSEENKKFKSPIVETLKFEENTKLKSPIVETLKTEENKKFKSPIVETLKFEENKKFKSPIVETLKFEENTKLKSPMVETSEDTPGENDSFANMLATARKKKAVNVIASDSEEDNVKDTEYSEEEENSVEQKSLAIQTESTSSADSEGEELPSIRRKKRAERMVESDSEVSSYQLSDSPESVAPESDDSYLDDDEEPTTADTSSKRHEDSQHDEAPPEPEEASVEYDFDCSPEKESMNTHESSPSSGEKRKLVHTPHDAKKRRKSVNAGMLTHSPKTDYEVVKEELMFSPKGEAMVLCTPVNDGSERDTEGYEAFSQQVDMRANSTRIQDKIEDEEADEEADGEADEEADEEANGEADEEADGAEESGEDESDSDDLDMTPEEVERYNQLLIESKKYKKSGEFKKALKLAIAALKIYSGDEAVVNFAKKLQAKVKQSS